MWLTLALTLSIAQGAPDAADTARVRFQAGVTQYKLAHFEEALSSFEGAYEAKPLPGFLFNIAQCHFQLRQYERAIFFYDGYLRGKPDARNRNAVQARMAEAKDLLEQERQALSDATERDRREGMASADANESADNAKRAEDAAARIERALEDADDKTTPAPEDDGSSLLLWGTVGAAGIAAIAATTAVVAVGGTTAFLIANQVALIQPSGTLGTLDRSPAAK